VLRQLLLDEALTRRELSRDDAGMEGLVCIVHVGEDESRA
jgi:hypothetical protein